MAHLSSAPTTRWDVVGVGAGSARDRERLHEGVRAAVAMTRHRSVDAITDGGSAGVARADPTVFSVLDDDARLDAHLLATVDASAFPTVPRANTHLATVMLGELMAERLGRR